MISVSPRASLLSLCLLAVLIFCGGVRFARQSESVRLERDREALRRFSGELQVELQRLEALSESDLARLARIDKPSDAFAVREAADRLIGVRQFSLLHRNPKQAGADFHVQIDKSVDRHMPVPVFENPRAVGASPSILLPREKLFDDQEERSGWINETGKPLMFWVRVASDEVVVLLIEPASVEAAITEWLKAWAAPRFEPVRAGRGPDQFRSGDGQVLLAEGSAPTERPDLLLPFRSHLGSWQLASWDRRETRVRYDPAVLAGSSVLAVMVALLGIVIFEQQRRASALAAQRVSFVNRVSHELRTPITNILLNVDLVSDLIEGAEPARRLGLVQEEARRLGRLIDNVLTFSRREQGKLRGETRACVPASVIRSVVEQFLPSFQRRALEVRCEGDLTAACLLDSDAFAQILANLLSNVEKYAPGGLVTIDGALADGTLTVTVTDQGPGIPAEAAERVFFPFERLDSRVNEGASGTGLGLAIARDLAVAMGGSLRLVPSSRGASFELRAPAPAAGPLSVISAA